MPPSPAPHSDVPAQAVPHIDVAAQAQALLPETVLNQEEIPLVSAFSNPEFTVPANSEPLPGPSGINITAGSRDSSDQDSSSSSSDSDSSSSSSDHARHNRNKRRKASKRRRSDSDSDSPHSKSSKALKAQVSSLTQQLASLQSQVLGSLSTFSHRRNDLSSTQEFDNSQLPEDSEVQEEEYDPLYPHSGYTPSEAPYVFHDSQAPGQPDSDSLVDHEGAYFFPEDARILDEFVVYRDSVIYHDSGALQFGRHNNQDTFRPNFHTPQVDALIEASSHVVPRKDHQDTKQQHFSSLMKAVNATRFRHHCFSASDAHNQTFSLQEFSRFLSSIPETYCTRPAYTHKPIPFFLHSADSSEVKSKLLEFAFAPKLSRDCHQLSGLLAGKTIELSDALRTKDYELRQSLAGILFMHEFAKLHSSISSQVLEIEGRRRTSKEFPPQLANDIKHMARLVDHAAVPTAQTLITNAVAKAKQCRYELREKAVVGISNQGAKTSLRDGSSFSKSLFDPNAITKAEECLKGAPVIVFSSNKPSRPQSFQAPGTSFSRGNSSRGGSYSFRGNRGRGSVPHSSHYSSYNPRNSIAHSGVNNSSRGLRGGQYGPYIPSRGISRANTRGGTAFRGDKSSASKQYHRQ